MTANILVVTPSTSFGESVKRALEETVVYRAQVVNNKASAVVRADEQATRLALLDLALGDDWVLEIGQALRTIRPEINLVVLCQEDLTPPALDGIRPWTLVRKPFRVAELMKNLSESTPGAIPTSAPSDTDLPWLSDVTRAAQHLTRLTLESSAQAALITRRNDLWAYAGGLSQSAAKEVAQTVTRNWDGQKGSDLLRFIRLESTKAEHMLYATRLASDVVLALVFDAETPFSTIRSQANALVTNLGTERPEVQKKAKPAPRPLDDFPADQLDEDEEIEIPPISDIINDIPAPNPAASATSRDLDLPPTTETPDAPVGETRVSLPLSNAAVFSREPTPAIHLNNLITADLPKSHDKSSLSETDLQDVEVTAPSRPRKRPETPVAKPAPGDLDVTRPGPTTEAARKITLEPTTAGLYHLTYACLLVPRFSSHYLTGDLSDCLSEWLPNICVAFGWRLEFLAVRPEYLQWVVNVRPNTSPGYLMRIMRQQTSEKIFSDFARLKKENPSGDFWAPGYLIMGGTQPHPPQLVRDYIRQTRQRQGQESTSRG